VIWKNAPLWCIVVRKESGGTTKTKATDVKRSRKSHGEHIMNDQAVRDRMCEVCALLLDQCRCFTVGDQVRFREVLDPGDESCLFDVTEDNGDRLMIRLVCDLPIRPLKVVRRADVCKA
jgi:hypothetical protein